MKKIVFALVFLVPLAFALTSCDAAVRGSACELGDFVFNSSTGEYLTTQSCNVSVWFPNGTQALNQVWMDNYANGRHNYSFTPVVEGLFPAVMSCENGTEVIRQSLDFNAVNQTAYDLAVFINSTNATLHQRLAQNFSDLQTYLNSTNSSIHVAIAGNSTALQVFINSTNSSLHTALATNFSALQSFLNSTNSSLHGAIAGNFSSLFVYLFYNFTDLQSYINSTNASLYAAIVSNGSFWIAWNSTFIFWNTSVLHWFAQNFSDLQSYVNSTNSSLHSSLAQNFTDLQAYVNSSSANLSVNLSLILGNLSELNAASNSILAILEDYVVKTNDSVVVNETVLIDSYLIGSNETFWQINYTIQVPFKLNYSASDWLPIRIDYWFINATDSNLTCVNASSASTTPACIPVSAYYLGKVGANTTFLVNLTTNLPVGVYVVIREVSIDPQQVWQTYARGAIGYFYVAESQGINTPYGSLPFTELGIVIAIILIMYVVFHFLKPKKPVPDYEKTHSFAFFVIVAGIMLLLLGLVHAGSNFTVRVLAQPDNPPYWSSNQTNTSTAGVVAQSSVFWADDHGLSGHIFSFDNGEGVFVNDSWTAFPASNKSWSNASKVLNASSGVTVRWMVYANDSSNLWNMTSVFSFVTVAVPVSPPGSGSGSVSKCLDGTWAGYCNNASFYCNSSLGLEMNYFRCGCPVGYVAVNNSCVKPSAPTGFLVVPQGISLLGLAIVFVVVVVLCLWGYSTWKHKGGGK
jgi:hypothetical protein